MSATDFMLRLGRPVAFYPGLVKHLGSVNAVLFFCQLLYWTGKEQSELGIYKSTDEMKEETGMTYREQATARKQLVKIGLLVETHKRLEHRIYYRLNLDRFDEIMRSGSAFDHDDEGGNSRNAESAIREESNGCLPKCGKRNSGDAQPADGGEAKPQFDPTETTTETTSEKPLVRSDDGEGEGGGLDGEEPTSEPAWPSLFDLFWAAYPRKVAKAAAEKAFAKHKPGRELLQAMLDAIGAQRKTDSWSRDGGRFIPHPATWLNQGRWLDELPAPSVKRSSGYDEQDYHDGLEGFACE